MRLIAVLVLVYLALQFTSGWGDVGAVLAGLVALTEVKVDRTGTRT